MQVASGERRRRAARQVSGGRGVGRHEHGMKFLPFKNQSKKLHTELWMNQQLLRLSLPLAVSCSSSSSSSSSFVVDCLAPAVLLAARCPDESVRSFSARTLQQRVMFTAFLQQLLSSLSAHSLASSCDRSRNQFDGCSSSLSLSCRSERETRETRGACSSFAQVLRSSFLLCIGSCSRRRRRRRLLLLLQLHSSSLRNGLRSPLAGHLAATSAALALIPCREGRYKGPQSPSLTPSAFAPTHRLPAPSVDRSTL